MIAHPISIEMLEEGHLLLLGTTGAGKTYQQRGFLERLRRAGRRVGAVDKLGNHWGLTLSADGARAGLDFVIFGGKRGHVPMTPADGAKLGRLFVERNIPAIFDVSQWLADEQLEWMEDFANAVFLYNDDALHLGLDEAQSWVPQGGGGDSFRSVLRLAEQGRGNGIRLMMAAQRLSRIDKSAAGMASVVVAMRQTGTADRKAMRDLLAADAEQMAMIERDLPGLPTGTAFVWDPLKATLDRHAFPQNTTFDSSRTPRHGDKAPASIAVSSELVEELRKALAPPATDYADGSEAMKLSSFAVSNIADRDDRIADLEAANAMLEATAVELGARQERGRALITAGIDAAISDLQRLRLRIERENVPEPIDVKSFAAAAKSPRGATIRCRPNETAAGGSEPFTAAQAALALQGSLVPLPSPAGAAAIDVRSLAILAAIAPAGLTEAAWAGRAGRARKGGAWQDQRRRYAKAHLIEQRDGRWFATETGVQAAGSTIPAMPSPGPALVDWWAARLRRGGGGKLLHILFEKPGLTRAALAAEAGMTATGGAFSAYVQELKRNELIEERGKQLFVAAALTGETQP